MIKDKAFWVFVSILVCIIAFCAGLAIRYRDEIVFAPAQTINDGIEFLFGLVSMIISFWVAEIYWKRKTERQQTMRSKEQLVYFLNRIAKIVFETSKALSEKFDEEDISESERRDREVLANLRRLGDARENALRIIDISSLELERDKRASKASSHFRSEVVPVLQELSTRSYVRPNVESVEQGLASVGDKTHDIVRYLQGEFDESRPPWQQIE